MRGWSVLGINSSRIGANAVDFRGGPREIVSPACGQGNAQDPHRVGRWALRGPARRGLALPTAQCPVAGLLLILIFN